MWPFTNKRARLDEESIRRIHSVTQWEVRAQLGAERSITQEAFLMIAHSIEGLRIRLTKGFLEMSNATDAMKKALDDISDALTIEMTQIQAKLDAIGAIAIEAEDAEVMKLVEEANSIAARIKDIVPDIKPPAPAIPAPPQEPTPVPPVEPSSTNEDDSINAAGTSPVVEG